MSVKIFEAPTATLTAEDDGWFTTREAADLLGHTNIQSTRNIARQEEWPVRKRANGLNEYAASAVQGYKSRRDRTLGVAV